MGIAGSAAGQLTEQPKHFHDNQPLTLTGIGRSSVPWGRTGEASQPASPSPTPAISVEPAAPDEIVVVLPGEPKGKGRPRFSSTGHPYTPPETRAYEAALAKAAKAAMAGCKPLMGAVEVMVDARMPIPTKFGKLAKQMVRDRQMFPVGKPDIDNVLKSLDALNGIVFVDDAQVVRSIVEKSYSDAPALIVRVRPYRPQAPGVPPSPDPELAEVGAA